MDTIKFIEETKIDGSVIYFTEKNGEYVDSSLSYHKEKAKENFERAKEMFFNGGKPLRKTLEGYFKNGRPESDCCGATPSMEGMEESGICSKCKDHCEYITEGEL